jgi:hypothetical protein
VLFRFNSSADVEKQRHDMVRLVSVLLTEICGDAALAFAGEVVYLLCKGGQLTISDRDDRWPLHLCALLPQPYERAPACVVAPRTRRMAEERGVNESHLLLDRMMKGSRGVAKTVARTPLASRSPSRPKPGFPARPAVRGARHASRNRRETFGKLGRRSAEVDRGAEHLADDPKPGRAARSRQPTATFRPDSAHLVVGATSAF